MIMADLSIDARDGTRHSAIEYAVCRGDPETARWLLEHGAELKDCRQFPWGLNYGESTFAQQVEHVLSRVTNPGLKDCVLAWLVRNEVGTEISHMWKTLSKVNVQDRYGKTLLHYVTEQKDFGFMQWLVDLNLDADFNIADNNGVKPTTFLNPHLMTPQLVEWLATQTNVEYLGDPPEPILCCAVKSKLGDEVIEWLARVKKVDGTEIDTRGNTALHVYLRERYHLSNRVCMLLAGNGKCLDKPDEYGERPLFYYLRSLNADVDVLKDWVDGKGADINIVDEAGFNVLHWTALHRRGRRNSAPWLNHFVFMGVGRPPIAEEPKRAKIVEWLLNEKGLDVNATTKDGQTALHYAFNREIAKVLVENGADMNALDNYGQSPITAAASSDRLDVAAWLASVRTA